MPVAELLAAYYDARRTYVERKFARDSQRARLEWLKAKSFMAGTGGVTSARPPWRRRKISVAKARRCAR